MKYTSRVVTHSKYILIKVLLKVICIQSLQTQMNDFNMQNMQSSEYTENSKSSFIILAHE